jgi:uncharacterized protein
MNQSPPVNVIVKVTRDCNFHCEYCHDTAISTDTISFQVLAQTIAKFFKQSAKHNFRFIWHGGEPLLLGIEFFLKALALQSEFISDGQHVQNTLQTNGYLLDDNFANFFRDYNFTIGLSLDGPEGLHDLQRRNVHGQPTFQRVMKAVSRLQRLDIPFGVLTVFTSKTLLIPPRALFDFYRQHGIQCVAFLPVRSNCNLEGENLPASNFHEYMMEAFDEWLYINDANFEVREFKELIALALGLPGTQCSSSGNCLGTTFSVEPNGGIYICDKFVGDQKFLLGAIFEADFDSHKVTQAFNGLHQWVNRISEECIKCDWRNNCGGGCPHDRYLQERLGTVSSGCSFAKLLAHVRQRVIDHPSIREIDMNKFII